MKTLIITALAAVAVAGFSSKADARDHWFSHHHHNGSTSFGFSIRSPFYYSGSWRASYSHPLSYYRSYSYAPSVHTFTTSVSRYSTSASVQVALAELGYYQGSIDGVIGPMSRNAIRRYQIDSGLPVTGVVDYPLMRSLAVE
jgi:hypothetical protein